MFLPASELKTSVTGTVGRELLKPNAECRWFLREKVFDQKEWNGSYTGRKYCMYTCAINKSSLGTAFVDVSCCPHLNEIDIKCELIETARELEGYYIAKHKEVEKKSLQL